MSDVGRTLAAFPTQANDLTPFSAPPSLDAPAFLARQPTDKDGLSPLRTNLLSLMRATSFVIIKSLWRLLQSTALPQL
ncbi:hypothetical protein VKT23_012861 [Stygiomarasmius scandens]|uniref:Uncharacterized protein n=1 Tax=Marasmiellus scandens TaxID=2682957 RepID=A0ABR1J8I2_9AGAR